jgi:dTDP-4-amino-4,6-dideoxygalactose transaminase
LFPQKLHVGCPNLGNRAQLLARIEQALDRCWLTNDGPFVQEFERALGAVLGVEHCVAVCNATLGLQLAIRALGLRDEVIVPSFTFPATVHALAWQGVTPVFCDVDRATHQLDPAEVERLIGPHTSGILAVHLWGNACNVEGLTAIAKRHNLRLLFDAAHAFGCSHGERMIGNFGDAEVFSFHATKFLNSAEGGAIATNDDRLAAKLRRLRSFGIAGDAVDDVGTNGKMNELSAAMGLTSLESRGEFVDRNRENHAAYRRALAEVAGLRLLAPSMGETHNWQYVVVEVDERQAGRSRDEIVAALHAENVLAKRYFWPGCHRMTPYRKMRGVVRRPLANTEWLSERLMQLPTGTAVSTADIARIGRFLGRFARQGRRAA